ncbi:hypothetical protein, partial [Helicobacter sp. 13S00482-2]|uniref:hypothetical protein n=1 Tax=Helicobacter sp. 13S00482-2 TaxID=1476200 RepID=UPI0015D99AA3
GLTSKELTATINNIGGRLSMNFIGSNTAVPTDATNNPIHFQGDVYAYNDAISNIDFVNTLWASTNGTNIIAANHAINNISYESSLKILTYAPFQTFLTSLPTKVPIINIYTQNDAQNNLALSGVFSARGNIYYQGGITHLILADNSTGSFKNYLDNSLNFTDIVNTEESIASGMLNNRTYKNGLI